MATLVTYSLTHSLTNLPTNSCLVDLIDVTLTCKNANSKLVDVVVVTVADVDDEEHVGNSLVEIFDAEDCSRYQG